MESNNFMLERMDKALKRLVFLIGIFLLALPLTAQDEPGVVINVDEVLVEELSPFVYGANYGPLSVVTVDLFDAAKESGITFIRFPGGRRGDEFELKKFEIDGLMALCKLMNATPSIQVRLENGTPEAAAELVRYTNIEKDYNVRYWYIGNEPNLWDGYTVARHAAEWRAIAEAMKAVDPDIMLIGPEIGQWNGTPQVDPKDSEGVDWMRGFLKANGDIVDIVSIHRYPFPLNKDAATDEQLRDNTPEWSTILENLRQVILEETGRTDLPVSINEVNSHWVSDTNGVGASFYNAIWWADSFGRLLQDDPFMINFFELQSPPERSGLGMMSRDTMRPTYYTYQLYKHFGTKVVASESSIETLSVFAAVTEEGALTLIAVNRGDDEISTSLTINGFEGDVSETRLLTEDVLTEVVDNTFLQDGTLTLPARSAALFILEPAP